MSTDDTPQQAAMGGVPLDLIAVSVAGLRITHTHTALFMCFASFAHHTVHAAATLFRTSQQRRNPYAGGSVCRCNHHRFMFTGQCGGHSYSDTSDNVTCGW